MPYNIRRLDLTALPFSPTNHEAVLPDFPVVYVIFNQDEVFYVGATKSLFKRWNAHRSDWKVGKCLKKKNTRVAWIKASIEQLADFELALIQFLNPKLNSLRIGRTYHHADTKRPRRRVKFQRLEA